MPSKAQLLAARSIKLCPIQEDRLQQRQTNFLESNWETRTTVKVVNAHLDVRYENIPPKFFNLPIAWATPMNSVEETSSLVVSFQTSFRVGSRMAAVLFASKALVLVIVEFAVTWALVAAAIALPLWNKRPAIESIASGTRTRANDPARCASRGTVRRKSMAIEGSLRPINLVGLSQLSAGRAHTLVAW